MNKGVEILLARMGSHPQEFNQSGLMGRYGRWTAAIEQIRGISSSFTQEERDAVNNKLRELEREEFTNSVMKRLLDGQEEPWQQYAAQAAAQAAQAFTKDRAAGKLHSVMKQEYIDNLLSRQQRLKSALGVAVDNEDVK